MTKKPDPIRAIKRVMRTRKLVNKDLILIFGTRSRVSEILNYQRPLTVAHIRRLHHYLGIPAEVLIQPPRRDP